jgi:hypothetical protein
VRFGTLETLRAFSEFFGTVIPKHICLSGT